MVKPPLSKIVLLSRKLFSEPQTTFTEWRCMELTPKETATIRDADECRK